MWTIYNNYLSKSFIIIIFSRLMYNVTEISRKRSVCNYTVPDFEAFFTCFLKLNPAALVQT